MSSEIVFTTQFRPPSVYAVLSGCLLIAEVALPFLSVQAGIGTIRSRGKLTTVIRRGSWETWTSRFTSLSEPSASAPEHRSPKRSLYFSSQVSTPVSTMLKPPSYSPMSGGIGSWPSISTAFAETVLERS